MRVGGWEGERRRGVRVREGLALKAGKGGREKKDMVCVNLRECNFKGSSAVAEA